jgi:pimeloyl-ACP methyl ester carboxylesterase
LAVPVWNVYGVSYGSDLALQLLRDHPEGIRSLVLDSVVPPQVNLIEGFWPNAAEGFRALFDACRAQASCAAAYPNLDEEFTATVRPGLIGYGLTVGVRADGLHRHRRIQAAGQQALPGFPDTVLALPPQAPRIVDDCAVWDVGAAGEEVHDVARSDAPVLMLSGSFDAVTPPSWARVAAESLPRSRIVEFPGLGHDVVAASDCARSIMTGFLERPDGGYDTSCRDRMTDPEFTTS